MPRPCWAEIGTTASAGAAQGFGVDLDERQGLVHQAQLVDLVERQQDGGARHLDALDRLPSVVRQLALGRVGHEHRHVGVAQRAVHVAHHVLVQLVLRPDHARRVQQHELVPRTVLGRLFGQNAEHAVPRRRRPR